MSNYEHLKHVICDAKPYTDITELRLVNRMRLTLSISILMVVLINPSGLSTTQEFTWFIFIGYFFYSVLLHVLTFIDHPITRTVLPHRIDVLWFALIVCFTGSIESFFFLFFFFAILTSSFRWGYVEGAKVTIASALLFVSCGLTFAEKDDLPLLLLRTTFLLTIGYSAVYWGESKVRLMNQLVLLREVSQLSNPRFGVSKTIANILDKTRSFYNANSCILVMQDKENGNYFLQTTNKKNDFQPISNDPIDSDVASLLLARSHDYLISYSRPAWKFIGFFLTARRAYDCTRHCWIKKEEDTNKTLTELVGARSFISTPVSFRKQQGRLYVISNNGIFSREDALFLNNIVTQSFPVVDSIDCLDKMASDAAFAERQRISLDIHDRTIQPYIGLKLALNAIKNKASIDNPLMPDIDKLARMAEGVITDLRNYAVTFKTVVQQDRSMFHAALQKESKRITELYGIKISLELENELELNDRLAVELLQFVHEGISNICRHTLSQHGAITLKHVNGWVILLIKNASPVLPTVSFLPKSIHQRAIRLGGNVQVMQEFDGTTVVHIGIPV